MSEASFGFLDAWSKMVRRLGIWKTGRKEIRAKVKSRGSVNEASRIGMRRGGAGENKALHEIWIQWRTVPPIEFVVKRVVDSPSGSC